MASTIDGPISWGVTVDDKGDRDYLIRHQVRALTTDGPYTILNTPGLPVVGAVWNFDGDLDPWAFCWPTKKVTMVTNKEPNRFWTVESLFSTRPRGDCREGVDNPLLLPQRISGSFVKYVREVTQDRFGKTIRNSSFELLRGPIVEFDHNRPTVQVEQNVSTLDLATCAEMMDHVNEVAMWGLEPRQVKLSQFSWSSNIFGTCNEYFTRFFEFDINFEGFDRKALDEGTKVLRGHWEETGWVLDQIDGEDPDPLNPQHFIRFKDRNGENARTLLDGEGKPLGGATGTADDDDPAVEIDIEYYKEANFFELGIPSVLG